MKAHAHTILPTCTWLGGCAAAHVAGVDVPPMAVWGGAAVAGGCGIAPDLDTLGTAARALGWPGRILTAPIRWLTVHRGATHWASTCLLAAAGVYAALALTDSPWPALVILTVTIAWFEAGFAADDKPRQRIAPWFRWCVAAVFAALILAYDPAVAWLPWAVLVGLWGHLLGDMCTTDRWPAGAPFTWREFGGWRIVRPSEPGERVSWTERVIESVLWLGCLALALTITDTWGALTAFTGGLVDGFAHTRGVDAGR